jgi:hypothetical protein
VRSWLRALLVAALIAVPSWHPGARALAAGGMRDQVAAIVAQGAEGTAVVPQRPTPSSSLTSRLEQRARALPTSAVPAWLLLPTFGITILAAWARRFGRAPTPVLDVRGARAPPALPLPC